MQELPVPSSSCKPASAVLLPVLTQPRWPAGSRGTGRAQRVNCRQAQAALGPRTPLGATSDFSSIHRADSNRWAGWARRRPIVGMPAPSGQLTGQLAAQSQRLGHPD